MNAAIEDLPSTREIASLAVAQYAQALINFFTPSIVVLIIIARLGAVHEARYYLPALIAGGVAGFLWNLNTSFLVEASRDPARLRQHANVTIRAALVVLVPAVLIGIALAPEILRIFGNGYAVHGTTLLRLQLLALPGTAVTAFYSAFSWLDKRVWRLAIRDLVLAVELLHPALHLDRPIRHSRRRHGHADHVRLPAGLLSADSRQALSADGPRGERGTAPGMRATAVTLAPYPAALSSLRRRAARSVTLDTDPGEISIAFPKQVNASRYS